MYRNRKTIGIFIPQFLSFFLLFCSAVFADSNSGSTSSSLDTALQAENINNGVVNFNATVNLVEQVRAVQSDPTFTFIPNANITINGMNQTLNGQGTTRGFFVGGRNANSTGMVTINDLLFSQCRAKGVMAKVVAWELAAAFLLGKALL